MQGSAPVLRATQFYSQPKHTRQTWNTHLPIESLFVHEWWFWVIDSNGPSALRSQRRLYWNGTLSKNGGIHRKLEWSSELSWWLNGIWLRLARSEWYFESHQSCGMEPTSGNCAWDSRESCELIFSGRCVDLNRCAWRLWVACWALFSSPKKIYRSYLSSNPCLLVS